MIKIYHNDCKWCERLFTSLPLLATKQDVKNMERIIMTKLSELLGKLTEANVKLDKIAVDVLALKDATPTTDPELSAATETELVALDTKVKAIQDILAPPPVVIPPA